jgi:hypothetical protein
MLPGRRGALGASQGGVAGGVKTAGQDVSRSSRLVRPVHSDGASVG